MTEHNLDWYAGLAAELQDDFANRNTMFDEIDKMARPQWSLPADFTATIKDVMAVVDSAPSDAILSGAITLSGRDPIFSVNPRSTDLNEYDQTQMMEDMLSWHFHRDNRRGNGTLMFDIADNSLRYNTICVRTDDLAYILPKDKSKWTPLQRRAWSQGRFVHRAVKARNVYYVISSFGLSNIVHIETLRLGDVIKHWSLYENNETKQGRRVAEALTRLREAQDRLSSGGLSRKVQYFTQVYCLDDDKLAIWGDITGTDVNNNAVQVKQVKPAYVFADQKNELGFLNWSVRVAGARTETQHEYMVNPMLAPLYWSNSWNKINLAKSIIYSEPIRRAREPRGVSQTTSGEGVTVDHENGADINLRTGEDYKKLQPIQMDEGAMAIVSALEAAMNRTTGASMIGDTTKISSNTPFATYSAMIKVALSRLNRQNEIMAESCADIACNMMWWAEKSDVPLTAYAQNDKRYRSGKIMPRGQQIVISPEDYDLDSLGITAKVISATPTDQMEQLNMAVILSTKLNMPVSKLMEDMGYENYGVLYDLYTREFLQNSQLQAEAAGMLATAQGQAQLQIQTEAMQQQQEAQNQAQGVSNTAFGNLGGTQGFNPALGGSSPAQGAPSMTREQVSNNPNWINKAGV